MSSSVQQSGSAGSGTEWSPVQWAGAVLLWLWVVVPFGYGLAQLFTRIPALFGG